MQIGGIGAEAPPSGEKAKQRLRFELLRFVKLKPREPEKISKPLKRGNLINIWL